MKSSQRYTALLVTASLVLAVSASAQGNVHTAGSKGNAVTRVTKDSVENRFTAKDLIGAPVHDRAGDKIGDIADIDLQGSVPGTLSRAFNNNQATDRAGNPTMSTSGAAERADAHATVLVSVGGLFGVGDDLVSVPMSALTYNSTKERFEMSTSKAEIVALAEGKSQGGYAADAPMASATRAGKQSFADEANRVKEALKADPMTSAFAASVIVTADGENLRIQGLVDNKEQKQRILDTARRATPLKVEDDLETR